MKKFIPVTLRRLTKQCLLTAKVVRGASYLRSPGIVILRYHSILENPRELDDIIGGGIVHSAMTFEQQMRLIAKYFVPVTMDDVWACLVDGKKLPRRAIAVTFDDGFADNAEIAAPIMNRYGIRGTFYVTTGSIAPQSPPWFILLRRAFQLTRVQDWLSPLDGVCYQMNDFLSRRQAFLQACSHCAILTGSRQREWLVSLDENLEVASYQNERQLMMTEEQIRLLHISGHTIGSHTVFHTNIAQIQEESMIEELRESKKSLEKVIGSPILNFSYPSPILQPHYDSRTIKISKDEGYKTAVTCTDGAVFTGHNPLALRRISVPDDLMEFHWRVENALAGYSSN